MYYICKFCGRGGGDHNKLYKINLYNCECGGKHCMLPAVNERFLSNEEIKYHNQKQINLLNEKLAKYNERIQSGNATVLDEIEKEKIEKMLRTKIDI